MPIISYPQIPMLALYTLAAETYPLDISVGSVATGAWSTRKLAAAYAGNALTLRRTSDDATQGIGFANYVLDFAAIQSFAGGLTGRIPTWNDQTGNSRDVTQATLVNQPVLLDTGAYFTTIGNYPGLDFRAAESINTAVATSTLVTTSAGTIFAVFNADTTTATAPPDGRAVWANAGLNISLTLQDGVVIAAGSFDTNNDIASNAGYSTGTSYIVVWRHGGGNLDLFVNSDTAVATVAAGTSAALSGAFRVGNSPSTAFDGRIAELICYDTALSTGDIDLIGQAMAAPYGLTWT